MMIRRAVVAASAMLLAISPSAAGEQRLKGPEILKTLTGARVEAPGWSQTFDAGGATLYVAGDNQSSGRWDVRGDEYCSVWPPSDVWACYGVSVDDGGLTVSWISSDGSRSSGHLVTDGK